ncbi:hypothetical protein BSFA1_42030 [Burkholderia sp. SFA1]|nr:hypothetical protein BSFA1_42030 [Burkholderia sp. SFA1]
MKTFVHIFNGSVFEVITPATYESDSPEGIEPTYKAGDEIPIDRRFAPEFAEALIDITGVNPMPQFGWTYDGSNFAPPQPDPVDYESANAAEQIRLMAVADSATFGMADAFMAGLLDDTETKTFKAWASYKLALSKVNLKVQNPAWPTPPATT